MTGPGYTGRHLVKSIFVTMLSEEEKRLLYGPDFKISSLSN